MKQIVPLVLLLFVARSSFSQSSHSTLMCGGFTRNQPGGHSTKVIASIANKPGQTPRVIWNLDVLTTVNFKFIKS